jgi:pSer/pThr/pTyr-binding forkhead associated (FHA) protein
MSDDSHEQATIQGAVSVARVPHKLKPHFLDQIKGEGTPAHFELAKEETIVGRVAGADIPLAGDKVSRRHAVIRRRNQEYSVYDLDSLHGVLLNGIKVHSAVLRDEDVVQFADMVFIYREG